MINFSFLPKRLKYLLGAVFLGFGVILLGFAIGGLFGYFGDENPQSETLPRSEGRGENSEVIQEKNTLLDNESERYLSQEGEITIPDGAEVATFAGGCFWCIEASLQETPGVLEAISGFANGTSPDPKYKDVARGRTDWREAVQVIYDPTLVSYERLLAVYRESIDADDAGGQFSDRGFQYTTALYWSDGSQRQMILDSLEAEQKNYEQPIATVVEEFTGFIPAGPEHQDFYKNSATRYKQYERGSGRVRYQKEKSETRNQKSEKDIDSETINPTRHLEPDERSREDQPESNQEDVQNQNDDSELSANQAQQNDIVPSQDTGGNIEGNSNQNTNTQDDELQQLEEILNDIFADETDEVIETQGEVRVESDTVVTRDASTFTKPTQAELREQLSFMQYRVTQNDGTEPPFANAYRDNKQEGIYVDIVSGEPLFSSVDKYKSGTGRPSFTQPIGGDTTLVTLHEDNSLFATRTEARSSVADSHLGHVFDDGPADRGGLRYCMNSAAMEFVPYDQMQERGYSEWMEFVK